MRYELEQIWDNLISRDEEMAIKFINRGADQREGPHIYDMIEFNDFCREKFLLPEEIVDYTRCSFSTSENYFTFDGSEFHSSDYVSDLVDNKEIKGVFEWWMETYGADGIVETLGINVDDLRELVGDEYYYRTDCDYDTDEFRTALETLTLKQIFTEEWGSLIPDCPPTEED